MCKDKLSISFHILGINFFAGRDIHIFFNRLIDVMYFTYYVFLMELESLFPSLINSIFLPGEDSCSVYRGVFEEFNYLLLLDLYFLCQFHARVAKLYFYYFYV